MAEPSSGRSHNVGAHLRTYAYESKQRFQKVQQYNIQTFRRQPLREISGSLGDLGTLLPLLIALSAHQIAMPTTLVVAGIANILTGLFFGIPLPVQPMKAIAAIALARDFNKDEVASAGLFVAGVVGFLSITGLIKWFTRHIPIPVIKGIQVGTGISLITYGGKLIEKSYTPQLKYNVLILLLIMIGFLALLASPMYPRLPFALIVLLVGIIGALPQGFDSHPPFGWGIWKPRVSVPSPTSFRIGAWEAGLGQVPLTTLNSIIAVCFLSADLLPRVQAPSTTSMGLSVMAINIVGCWFSSMPVCHGSGGLAAQYRFGARSGASVIFLGLIKLLLGLFAGQFTQNLFSEFPNSLLSIMVIAAGLELANVGESLNTAGARDLKGDDHDVDHGDVPHGFGYKKAADLTDEEKKRRWAIMIITVGGVLAFRNDAVGFLAGMLAHWSFQIHDHVEERRSQRGRIRLEPEPHQDADSPILRHEDI